MWMCVIVPMNSPPPHTHILGAYLYNCGECVQHDYVCLCDVSMMYVCVCVVLNILINIYVKRFLLLRLFIVNCV